MLILGITTSTQQVGCAIGGHEGVLAEVHSSRGRRHAESLTPAIDFLRQQARVELDEIGCVAIDVGPGLFTGLRVGIAAAKAMAHALRVPMIGVASLDLIAFPVRWSPRLVVAALDAAGAGNRRIALLHRHRHVLEPVIGGAHMVGQRVAGIGPGRRGAERQKG